MGSSLAARGNASAAIAEARRQRAAWWLGDLLLVALPVLASAELSGTPASLPILPLLFWSR